MDKLYFNGNILTMEEGDSKENSVLISGGYIKNVGNLEELKILASENCDMVDLDGKTLMPSFIDGHSHILVAAQLSNAANLSECSDFEEIIAVLKDYKEINNIKKDGVIFGFGYDHNFLPGGKHPTKEYLNQVSDVIPIYISHASGHMGCANDVALNLANINAETQNPQGGVIGRYKSSMEPNGYLEEAAMITIQYVIGPRMKFDLKKSIQQIQSLYAENGITTVQDGASSYETVNLMKSIALEEKLIVDVVSYPVMDEEVSKIMDENQDCELKYLKHFKLGGYKTTLDGSPQGKSAWMTQPYKNSGDYCAYSWHTDEEVERFMEIAIRDNKQVLAHCNGDAAGDQFIRCYKNALKKVDNPNKENLRPVMIHCQTVRRDQLEVMAEIKMIPSIFVGHVYYWGDIHLRNLGHVRAENISPCAWAHDLGLVVNFHQDTPVTKPKVLHSVWCAVNRQTKGGMVLGKDQRISVYDALKDVTINAAYAYFEEELKGSIKPGKMADLVILDRNPLEVAIEEIKDIQVLETIKEGETIFRA